MRLVLFDVYATLIKPRRPVVDLYADVFRPHFSVDPALLKPSFKTALKNLQSEKPSYVHTLGVSGWWSDVIRATAIGAGGDVEAVDKSLPIVVPQLMKLFSSREGYELYPDVMSTLHDLKARGIGVGVVSNGDARFRLVLEDLGLESILDACVLSEEEGIEKPNPEIWARGIRAAGLATESPSISNGVIDSALTHDVMHVGDELECDYFGAKRAGLSAALLRRPGELGAEERREDDEDLTNVEVVSSLTDIIKRLESSK